MTDDSNDLKRPSASTPDDAVRDAERTELLGRGGFSGSTLHHGGRVDLGGSPSWTTGLDPVVERDMENPLTAFHERVVHRPSDLTRNKDNGKDKESGGGRTP